MKKRNIKTGNVLFLDCVSAMACQKGDKNCTFVEIDEIKSDEKFLIMDSLSTLLIYNDENLVKEFAVCLINRLRQEGAIRILVVLESEVTDDLKKNLIAMCDKIIYI